MNVHEYQAKELFREFGVAVPEDRTHLTRGEIQNPAAGFIIDK